MRAAVAALVWAVCVAGVGPAMALEEFHPEHLDAIGDRARPEASAWLLAQLRSLESEAVDAVAALEPGAAWQRRYVHAWLTLDRLERTLDDAARNEGLMFTQRLEPGAGASDLERSAP